MVQVQIALLVNFSQTFKEEFSINPSSKIEEPISQLNLKSQYYPDIRIKQRHYTQRNYRVIPFINIDTKLLKKKKKHSVN